MNSNTKAPLITAKAPSNIALVKYMGKSAVDGNLPANGSLSMTLNSLCTLARVAESQSGTEWNPALFHGQEKVAGLSAIVPALSEKGRERILRHAARSLEVAPSLLSSCGIRAKSLRGVQISAANTFPAASGIASSASSFAAVTWAIAAASAESFSEFHLAWQKTPALRRALAELSRKGSGSSCRSMEGAWVRWEGEKAFPVEGVTLPSMTDFVLLAGKEEKEVSSSEAHQRVFSSPLWSGRVERATSRLAQVESALQKADLHSLAAVVWEESWEMHSLFHTSQPPFTYWLPRSLEILKAFSKRDAFGGLPPPVVTMDAGPNVHVLVPTSSADAWRAWIESTFPGLEYLEDQCGSGADGWTGD